MPITKLIQANEETDFDKLGKLTSCGPGIFANLINQLYESFKITADEQKQAVLQTLAGTIDYAVSCEKGFAEIISEVLNKGNYSAGLIN